MTPLAEMLDRRLAGSARGRERRQKDIPRKRKRQGGAFAILTVPVIFVILAMCGLALDIGMVYNRKVELHGIARAVALAAARELNGTTEGIGKAIEAGKSAAALHRYSYGEPFPWQDSIISFSDSPRPEAEWLSESAARARPGAMYYVKVDTSALTNAVGKVDTLIMRAVLSSVQSVVVNDKAVAGRSTINVAPIAVCAMSLVPGAERANTTGTPELVEYGFRRGVTYDLMALNPNGTSPVNFAVDPVSPPGGLGAAANTSASTLEPFVCTGRMWIPRVTGGPIRVSSPFPIGSLYHQLNSRFDDYANSTCNPYGAPPDYNIKRYAYDVTNGITWMNPKPGSHSAASQVKDSRLQTVADDTNPPASAGMYGPLWSYARAVTATTFREDVPEPAAGYTRFLTSDWAKLYPSGPSATSTSVPYLATSGNTYAPPRSEHRAISELNRRVLHIPLLSCPVAAGTNVGATAVAIGKFFMTVPATSTSLYAEFAGIAHESTVSGQVTLYP